MVSSALPSTLFPALDEYRWLGLRAGHPLIWGGVSAFLLPDGDEFDTVCLEPLVQLGYAYCDCLEQPLTVEFRAQFPTPSRCFFFQPSSSVSSSFVVCCQSTSSSPEANNR